MIHFNREEEFKQKLKDICCFDEKAIDSNVAKFHYLDAVEENKADCIAMNREITIDVLLGDEKEEKLNDRVFIKDQDEYPTISMKIFEDHINGKKFKSYEALYNEVLDFYINHTVNNKQTLTDVTLSSTTDVNQLERMITSKIIMGGNLIAINGRVSTANIVLMNPITQYERFYLSVENNNNLNGIKIITDHKIDKDKVIILRSETLKTLSTGVYVIKSTDNDQYFFKETNNWDKNIQWFYIK